ncbi:MAG: urate hydroxylase PuuD [Gammaproteobacteria bacterium]|nr:urate hydroxylase PuuD [Gammaproteobacteria bacterium]
MDVLVLSIERWVHFLSGVTWIGLLYYFNFVQVPAIAAANADKDGPGPAAINKYVAPRALVWFRWGAVVTWLSGAALLESAPHLSLVDAFTLQGASQVIGVGAWLGTIMLFNVWVLIWPNQKKVLGIVSASDEEKNRARRVALLASRTNTLLSIPMLLFMGASAHGLPY